MRWLLAIPLAVIALIIGLSIYLQPNNFIGCSKAPVANTSCDQADAIVVVSGGDTSARTRAGIDLYEEGWGDYLVLSGAAFDKSGPSNAAAMKAQAIQEGVPERAILVDEEAVNTQQNAENTQSILKERDFHDVILVTSGYHQRRASLEFNKRAEGTIIRNYPVVTDKDWGWYWWLTPRGWWLAGGETVKIIAFYIGATS
jgi:uncharacterized SAM-binding protein YcdF (DUF218 family)